MEDLLYKIKGYFTFSFSEVRDLAITIAVLAFCVAFYDGNPTPDYAFWVRNFINIFLIVALSIMVHVSTQKIYALKRGYNAEYSYWWLGLVIALAVTLLSNGKLWYFLPVGFLTLYHMGAHRLGMFRYNLQYKELGLIAVSGSVANIILALVFRCLTYLPLNEAMLTKAVLINVSMALTTMLPVPGLNGFHLLFASRPKYVFAAVGILLASFLMFVLNPIYTIIAAVVLAFFTAVLYMYYREI